MEEKTMARRRKCNHDEDEVSDREVVSVDDDQEIEERGVTCIAQMAGLSADHPLLNFYMGDKASSFIDKYQPCNERDPFAIRMSEAKLRSIFKAYVCPYGDPMKIYSMRLRLAGFYPTVDITGDMVYFLREKQFDKASNAWMIEAEELANSENINTEN